MTTVEIERLTPRVSSDMLRALERRVAVAPGAKMIPVFAPFTDVRIGAIPQASPDDVTNAVERSRAAQKLWGTLSPTSRGRILTRFHDLLIDRADVAMDIAQLEAGKARTAAFEEVFDAVATTRYYVNTAPGLLRRKRRAVALPGFTTAYEYAHPVGVVGVIAPWNFPFTLGISDAIAALLAGNGVVIKPDEKTPYSALWALQLLEEAGLPPGLAQIVTGHGEAIGEPLVDAVDFVMFTGSTPVGRKIAEMAGRRLIGSSVELGGKNALIVLEDANLDRHIPEIVRAVFANGGQLCIAAERIYVHESIRAKFTERFVAATKDLEMAPVFDYAGLISSLVDGKHLKNVNEHVEEALELGATLLTGGKPRPDIGPFYYEPTVLTDVDETMTLCRSETFGPVVSIYGFDDPAEAVERANDSDYGLNFSVWTADTGLGLELASQLRSGTVGVNDGYAATWSTYDAPMGGMKASGLSRRHGAGGLMKYTESQTIAVQRLLPAFAPPPGLGYERYEKLLGPALKILRRLPFYK